jgi:hypothetical protein
LATPELSGGSDYQSTDDESRRLNGRQALRIAQGELGRARDNPQVPKLHFSIDLMASPLELAGQALAVVRVQEFAAKRNLAVEEREGSYQRHFVLSIPADRMNDILWELDLQGLLSPSQVITGNPDLHIRLEERFSWLEWVDGQEEPK